MSQKLCSTSTNGTNLLSGQLKRCEQSKNTSNKHGRVSSLTRTRKPDHIIYWQTFTFHRHLHIGNNEYRNHSVLKPGGRLSKLPQNANTPYYITHHQRPPPSLEIIHTNTEKDQMNCHSMSLSSIIECCAIDKHEKCDRTKGCKIIHFKNIRVAIKTHTNHEFLIKHDTFYHKMTWMWGKNENRRHRMIIGQLLSFVKRFVTLLLGWHLNARIGEQPNSNAVNPSYQYSQQSVTLHTKSPANQQRSYKNAIHHRSERSISISVRQGQNV